MSIDCELPQYYKCIERVAAKSHKCCECRAPIISGEKYLEVRACWEGRPDTYRQHLLCEKACEYVRDNLEEDCIYYGGLKEWYQEWVRGGYSRGEDLIHRQEMWKLILRIKRRERRSPLPSSTS